MRYLSLLAVLVVLLGVGLAPKGVAAADDVDGVEVLTPGESALASLMTPLTKLTDKVFPDATGVVAQVWPGNGDPSTEYVIVGLQYGEGMASYSKLDSGLMDSWLALLDPSEAESSEMDAKAILDARDALLLAYSGGGEPSAGDDSLALALTQVTEVAA
jgi:hypothetical protein